MRYCQFGVSPVNYSDSAEGALSFRPWVISVGSFRQKSGSFRPGSFRSNFGVGRFGLGRWVDSALGRFDPGSFWQKSIPKCRLLIIMNGLTEGRKNPKKQLVIHMKIVLLYH